MSGVTWLADTLAAIMLATSGYCLSRPLAARRWHRQMHQDVNTSHVLMGVAMAGMLVPALNVISDGVWEGVFGVLVAWFAARSARFAGKHGIRGLDDDQMHHITHYLTHLVMSVGMLYMYLVAVPAMVTTARGEMGGLTASGSRLALVTLLLIIILFASAVWHADGLTRFAVATPASRPGTGSGIGRGTSTGTGIGPGTGAGTSVTAATGDIARTGASAAYAAGAALISTAHAPAGGTVLAATAVIDADSARQLAPRLEMGCHIAMCVTMGYMLILLL